MRGAQVIAQRGEVGNALQAAALEGKIGVVQLLLRRGADVNAQEGEVGSALQAAAVEGKIEIVQLLLERERMSMRRGVRLEMRFKQLHTTEKLHVGEGLRLYSCCWRGERKLMRRGVYIEMRFKLLLLLEGTV